MFIARCRAIACYGSHTLTYVSSNAYARCRAIACYGSHTLTYVSSNAYARCRAIACYGSQLHFAEQTMCYPHTSIIPTNEKYADRKRNEEQTLNTQLFSLSD